MKNLLLLAIFFLFCQCSVNAQWYNKGCGVLDIESATANEFDCMWKKAASTAKVGQITCVVGGGLALIGGITMLVANPCCSSGYTMVGVLAVEVGLIVTAVGIPIWAVGGSRKSKLKDSPHYKNSINTSLRISPSLGINQFNQKAVPALTIACRF